MSITVCALGIFYDTSRKSDEDSARRADNKMEASEYIGAEEVSTRMITKSTTSPS